MIEEWLVLRKEILDLEKKVFAYVMLKGEDKLVIQTTRPDFVVGSIVKCRMWAKGED